MSNDIGSMRSLLSACSSQSQEENLSLPKSPRWNRGWQCDKWERLGDLFGPEQRCSLCGVSFLEAASATLFPAPSAGVRELHLRVTHKVFACHNEADLYLDLEMFQRHMETVHAAKIGDWTQTLYQACLVQNIPDRPTEDNAGFEWEEINSGNESPCLGLGSAVEEWEDSKPQNDMEALMSSLWTSNLLGQWNSSRDRINRWMLHMLGAETKQADLHRGIFKEQGGDSIDIPNELWGRLILKYWFIDEAAIGFDLNAVATQIAQDEAANVNSSLHLSDRPSGTNSDRKEQKQKEQKRHETMKDPAEERRQKNRAAQRAYRRRKEEQTRNLTPEQKEEHGRKHAARVAARREMREEQSYQRRRERDIAALNELRSHASSGWPWPNDYAFPVRTSGHYGANSGSRAGSQSGSMSSIDEVLSQAKYR